MRLGTVVVTRVSKEVPCRHCKNSITEDDFLRVTIVALLPSGRRFSTALHLTCLSSWALVRLETHKKRVAEQHEKRRKEGNLGGRPCIVLSPEDRRVRTVLLRRRSRLYHRAAGLDIADSELDEIYTALVEVDVRIEEVGGLAAVSATRANREARRKLWYGEQRVAALREREPGIIPQARLVPPHVASRRRRNTYGTVP